MRKLIRYAGICVSLALASIAADGRAQSLSSYDQFRSLSNGELATLQIKLTPRTFVSTWFDVLVMHESSDTMRISAFRPFYRTLFNYSADSMWFSGPEGQNPTPVAVSVAGLRAIIDSVGTVPSVTAGTVDSSRKMSFSMIATIGGTGKGFEAIVDTTVGRLLLHKIRSALTTDATARIAVDRFACDHDLTAQDPATEVTSDARISFSGIRRDRRSGQYICLMRVTNTGGAAMQGPITVVLPMPRTDIVIIGVDGVACEVEPSGASYVIATTSSLPAGAHADRELRFANPVDNTIMFSWRMAAGNVMSPRVYAGLGER